MACAYFVSDLHLIPGAPSLEAPEGPEVPDDRTKLFVEFLRNLKSGDRFARPDLLFLVGDVFDLWVADHKYFRERFGDVVEAISDLVKSGVAVHYFEGNHDLYLEKFWQAQVGVSVHRSAADFDIDGKRVHVEHGDLINPNDHGYLFLRRFLRSTPLEFLGNHLPAWSIDRIGRNASRASRKYTSTRKELPLVEIRKQIRDHASRLLRNENFDLIVTGHVHVRDDFGVTIGERHARSINLGSWFEEPFTFQLLGGVGRFVSIPATLHSSK